MGRRAALSATATLLLSACATRPDSRIGPHGIDVIATAGGQPTIVFENGMGATLAGWAEGLAGLPPNASRFAYDRPGNGHSGAATTPCLRGTRRGCPAQPATQMVTADH